MGSNHSHMHSNPHPVLTGGRANKKMEATVLPPAGLHICVQLLQERVEERRPREYGRHTVTWADRRWDGIDGET